MYAFYHWNPPELGVTSAPFPLWRFDFGLCMIHVACKTMRAWILSWFSCVWLFATVWTIACQATLSLGFSRQEYWSELPCPPSGDLPDPGIKPEALASLTLAGRFFTTNATWEAHKTMEIQLKERIYASELKETKCLLPFWVFSLLFRLKFPSLNFVFSTSTV